MSHIIRFPLLCHSHPLLKILADGGLAVNFAQRMTGALLCKFRRMRVFLAALLAVSATSLYAETEPQSREHVDSLLTAGNMRAAIATRAAWLAHDIGARIANTVTTQRRYPDEPDPEFALETSKSEFDRLYANRNFYYENPGVPAKWSKLKDAYLFGHAKGVFDAICHDLGVSYDGSGDHYEAFAAGYNAGFKLGRASRR